MVTVRGAGRAPEARPPAARPTVAGLAALRPKREAGRDDGAWREEAGRTGAAAGRRDGETPPRALPREVVPRGTETLRLSDLLTTATILAVFLARKGYSALAVADAPAFASKRAIDATRKDSIRLGRNGAPAFADAHAVCVRIGACIGRHVTNTARSSRKIFLKPQQAHLGRQLDAGTREHRRTHPLHERAHVGGRSTAAVHDEVAVHIGHASAPHLGALASRRLDEKAG